MRYYPGITLEEVKKVQVLGAYSRHMHKCIPTANELGITTRTLYNYLVDYGIKNVEQVPDAVVPEKIAVEVEEPRKKVKQSR